MQKGFVEFKVIESRVEFKGVEGRALASVAPLIIGRKIITEHSRNPPAFLTNKMIYYVNKMNDDDDTFYFILLLFIHNCFYIFYLSLVHHSTSPSHRDID